MKALGMSPVTVAILAGAAVVGVILWRQGDNIADGVSTLYGDAKDAAAGTVDMVGGVLTGNNPVTTGARTTAYENAGILGTLGAATDRLLGGAPSTVGEYIGGKIFDWTH